MPQDSHENRDLTERQRFRESLLFGHPDRYFFDPGRPRESTLQAWYGQGFPQNTPYLSHLAETLGIPSQPPKPVDLGVSFTMIPAFEEKILEHRNGHYIIQDSMGAVTEISDQYDFSYIRSAKDFVTRKWHSFPVKTRSDWEDRIKWRYQSATLERFPSDFEVPCQVLKDRDHVFGLTINGPFWQLREWCGFEVLCALLIEEPELVQEMVEFWAEFVHKLLEPILARVQLDYLEISEDMAYKAHSMISPKMTRQFLLPCWTRWITAARKSGCPIVCVDSDGYIAELIPIWIEAGFNCTRPVEVAAHNDIVAYRKQYGTSFAFRQGLDKRCLAEGGEILRNEVMRVVPPLIKEGGFIPGCDHGVPPDISWQNYVEYSRMIAQLTGWL